MSIDILGALADTAPAPSGRKCKLQRELDERIPLDTPGRDRLLEAVNARRPEDSNEYRTLPRALLLLSGLGIEIGKSLIHEHRNQLCRCFR